MSKSEIMIKKVLIKTWINAYKLRSNKVINQKEDTVIQIIETSLYQLIHKTL